MAFHDAVLADSPLIYLRCNELSGTVLADAAPGARNASLVGSYQLGQAPMRDGTVKAVNFTGGYARIPFASQLVPATDYSAEFIARFPTGTATCYLFRLSDDASPYRGTVIGINSNVYNGTNAPGELSVREELNSLSRSVITSGAGLNDNVYRHIVVCRRGLSLEVWIGGVLVAQKTLPDRRSVTSTAYLEVFGGAITFNGTGGLDEFAYYHSALPAERIELHARLAVDLWALRGNAKLDSGLAASRVVARNWTTHEHKGVVVPAVNGDFELFVPNGQYDVTVFGPEGYQPVTHGPVTTVEPS